MFINPATLFCRFTTPRLINHGQVNSAICYFNDLSSYEINTLATLVYRIFSFATVRAIDVR